MTLRRRLALLVSVVSCAALAAVPLATDASAIAPTSSYHPYSQPVWYPLHVAARMDCAKSNPRCPTSARHTSFSIDLIPDGQTHGHPSTTSHAGVYAMGAGRIVSVVRGHSCPAPASFGTEVDIDHGGGMISRYGHLGSVSVKTGQLVAAGQQIGTVGATGKGVNCDVNYLDFQVKYQGKNGTAKTLTSLYACQGSKRVSYPSAGTRQHYATWNQVPQWQRSDASGAGLIASSGSACLSNSVPATPNHASTLTLRKSGSNYLKASWSAAPSNAGTIRVEFSTYHPTTGTWDVLNNEKMTDLKASARSYTFTKDTFGKPFVHGHGHSYRVRVWFGNSTGWSVAKGWVNGTV